MIIETLVSQKKNLFQLPMNGKDFIVLYLIPLYLIFKIFIFIFNIFNMQILKKLPSRKYILFSP